MEKTWRFKDEWLVKVAATIQGVTPSLFTAEKSVQFGESQSESKVLRRPLSTSGLEVIMPSSRFLSREAREKFCEPT